MNFRQSESKAIRRILGVSSDYRHYLGTSFAVNSRTLLTCRHVVEAASPDERLVLEGGADGDIGRLHWYLNEDPLVDVALGTLHIDSPDFEVWLNPTVLDPSAWRSPICCIGYPGAGQALQQWLEGVAAPDYAFGQMVLQNSVHRGCSGGPVLDANKKLVAIIVSRDADGVDKHVLPVQNFYSWMEGCGFRIQQNELRASSENQSWLQNVPIGPIVRLSDVPQPIIDAFADYFPTEAAARAHVEAANRLVLNHNLENLLERQIILRRGEQPGFNRPADFWSEIFSMMGVKSRRSVASLLEAEGAPNFAAYDESEFQSFKEFLTKS